MYGRHVISLEEDLRRLKEYIPSHGFRHGEAYIFATSWLDYNLRERLERRGIVRRAGTGFQLRTRGIHVPLARPRAGNLMFYEVDAARIEPSQSTAKPA